MTAYLYSVIPHSIRNWREKHIPIDETPAVTPESPIFAFCNKKEEDVEQEG